METRILRLLVVVAACGRDDTGAAADGWSALAKVSPAQLRVDETATSTADQVWRLFDRSTKVGWGSSCVSLSRRKRQQPKYPRAW